MVARPSEYERQRLRGELARAADRTVTVTRPVSRTVSPVHGVVGSGTTSTTYAVTVSQPTTMPTTLMDADKVQGRTVLTVRFPYEADVRRGDTLTLDDGTALTVLGTPTNAGRDLSLTVYCAVMG